MQKTGWIKIQIKALHAIYGREALIVLVVLKGLFGKQFLDIYIGLPPYFPLPVHMNDKRNA